MSNMQHDPMRHRGQRGPRPDQGDEFFRGVMYALPLSAILWGFIVLGFCWSMM